MPDKKQTPLHITGMKVKDFLILKDVEITPDSKLNVFAGRNRNGKTSMIKALQVALRGTADKTKIRTGADKAEIMLEIGETKVKRTLKAQGDNTLRVTVPMVGPDGKTRTQVISAAQDFLDGLISDFSFDPLTFILLEGKEKVKYLRDLFRTVATPEMFTGIVDAETLGLLDFSKDGLLVCSDAERIIYGRRTKLNQTVDQKKALIKEYVEKLVGFNFSDYRDRLPEIQEKIKAQEHALTEARATQRQAEGTKAYVERLTKKIEENEAAVLNYSPCLSDDIIDHQVKAKEIQSQIAVLQGQLIEHETALRTLTAQATKRDELKKAINADKDTLSQLPSVDDIPDIAEMEDTLSELLEDKVYAEGENSSYAIFQEAEAVNAQYEIAKAEADAMTAAIKKLRADIPEQLSREANIPIKDLRFEGDTVMIGDKNIINMSTAEQVTVAVQIVEAFNAEKPLKVICVDRAESLDDETLAEFVRQIPEEYQFFLTMVSHQGQAMPAGAYAVEAGNVTKGEAA